MSINKEIIMIIKKEEVNTINFNDLRILDYTAKCNERSSFAIIKVPPNIGHQLSWSKRSDKFFYIVEGKIDFFINNNNYTLDKGDFCIIKKGDKFKYKNNTNKVVSLVLIHTPNFDLNEEVFE